MYGMLDRMSVRLRRHLATEVVGHHIYMFDTIGSTNRALAQLADRGATEGTVVLAETQTAGRGRHGSPWFSPDAANLYVSVLFHPRIAPRELPLFAPIASLACRGGCSHRGSGGWSRRQHLASSGGPKLGGVLVENRS